MASPTTGMPKKGEHLVAVPPFHAHALAVAHAETDAFAAFAGRARWRVLRVPAVLVAVFDTQKQMHCAINTRHAETDAFLQAS